jgi:hypothetical protein
MRKSPHKDLTPAISAFFRKISLLFFVPVILFLSFLDLIKTLAMKINILIMSACLLFMASSCTVNKRAHRPGYNVEWHSANPKPQKHPKAQEMEEQKMETEILAIETGENPIIDELENKLIEDEEMKEDNLLAGSGAEGILKYPFHFTFEEIIKPKNLDRQRADATTELSQEEIAKTDELASKGYGLTYLGIILTFFIAILSGVTGFLPLMIAPLVVLIFGIVMCHKSLIQMRQNPSTYQNRHLAVRGLWIGYIGLLVWLIGCLAVWSALAW